MTTEKRILLSFDVEEFDLPLEYKQQITTEEQLQIGYKGLAAIHSLLDIPSIETTLFTTAFFAQHYPTTIQLLSKKHEIGSHAFFHNTFSTPDLHASKVTLEQITGKEVYGLRMPRMQSVAATDVLTAGYYYNSSINPTWIPGRYNNRHLPRTLYREQKLLQFPVSVTPRLRIPLFWLAFKNLPYSIFLRLALQVLKTDNYLCLYFHPWEFINISRYQLPGYIVKGSNHELLLRLHRLIKDLSNEGKFVSIYRFIKETEQKQAPSGKTDF